MCPVSWISWSCTRCWVSVVLIGGGNSTLVLNMQVRLGRGWQKDLEGWPDRRWGRVLDTGFGIYSKRTYSSHWLSWIRLKYHDPQAHSLKQDSARHPRHWGWTLWEGRVKVVHNCTWGDSNIFQRLERVARFGVKLLTAVLMFRCVWIIM